MRLQTLAVYREGAFARARQTGAEPLTLSASIHASLKRADRGSLNEHRIGASAMTTTRALVSLSGCGTPFYVSRMGKMPEADDALRRLAAQVS
jgi:hypothetical protein